MYSLLEIRYPCTLRSEANQPRERFMRISGVSRGSYLAILVRMCAWLSRKTHYPAPTSSPPSFPFSKVHPSELMVVVAYSKTALLPWRHFGFALKSTGRGWYFRRPYGQGGPILLPVQPSKGTQTGRWTSQRYRLPYVRVQHGDGLLTCTCHKCMQVYYLSEGLVVTADKSRCQSRYQPQPSWEQIRLTPYKKTYGYWRSKVAEGSRSTHSLCARFFGNAPTHYARIQVVRLINPLYHKK